MEMGQQVKDMRENVQQATTVRWSMLLMECSWLSETPNMQCNKRILITDGGMKIPTLTEGTRVIVPLDLMKEEWYIEPIHEEDDVDHIYKLTT